MADRGPAGRRLVIAVAVVGIVVAAIALALFQPWKLWVDDTVDQAAPAGAAPLAASTVPTTVTPPAKPPAPTPATVQTTIPATIPATVPVTTVPLPPPTTEFVSLDHGTSGRLVLLQGEGGQRFVRFEDLDTSNGPDLKVYLTTNPVDGSEEAFDDDFIDLGRLQGNVGNQNYEVPAGADLGRFRSVVIWCDRFDSAFGAASLA